MSYWALVDWHDKAQFLYSARAPRPSNAHFSFLFLPSLIASSTCLFSILDIYFIFWVYFLSFYGGWAREGWKVQAPNIYNDVQ